MIADILSAWDIVSIMLSGIWMMLKVAFTMPILPFTLIGIVCTAVLKTKSYRYR